MEIDLRILSTRDRYSDSLTFIRNCYIEAKAFYFGKSESSTEHKYIGAKQFYPDYALDIKKLVLGSDRILAQAQQRFTAQPKPKHTLEHFHREVWQHTTTQFDAMMAKMNNTNSMRYSFPTSTHSSITSHVVNSLMSSMFSQGVNIRASDLALITQTAVKAHATKTPLIFLPCHKSHVDYILISYALYRMGIALPHIAAGENLNLPVVGTFLRNGGAFMIKRVWGDESVYTEMMKEYIQVMLKSGSNMEIFIEGGRSRMGKLLQPKLGLLKIILDTLMSNQIKDAIIIPLSIDYDKIVETPSYIDELLGHQKEKESIGQLLGGLGILGKNYGRADLSFATPFSLREYCDKVGSKARKEGESESVVVLRSLGFKVLSDINYVSVAMPTALVGTVLLTLRGRGVGKDELIRKVNWLVGEIEKKGGRVADFKQLSTKQVVEGACELLKDIIGIQNDLIEPVYFPLKPYELSYYRNQVIHLFISETLYATIKAGGPLHDQKVSVKQHLIEDVAFLSSLLKYEFIFDVGGLQVNLENTLTELQAANIISYVDSAGDIILQDSTVEKYVVLSDEERRIGRENFDFYCFLQWPFIETYWLASISLFALIPENFSSAGLTVDANPIHRLPRESWVDERQFLNRCQVLAKTLYHEGDLSYHESINKETIKNALSRLLDSGLILLHKHASPPSQTLLTPDKKLSVTWIALHPDWLPSSPLPHLAQTTPPTTSEIDLLSVWHYYRPQGRLWEFCERIGRYRREGKNRRDSQTVASRVLRLARVSRSWVFDGKTGRHIVHQL